MMTWKIDENYLLDLLTQMVQIDSRNPTLTPDAPGETELGAFVADELRKLNLDVKVYALEPNRVNVVGVLRGTGDGKSLMLNAHLDTVGVEGMDNPFGAVIRDGKMFGRGTQDMKASLSAMMATLKAIQEAGISLGGDLIFSAVADEEALSIGAEHLVKHHQADAVIVTEPTDMHICRGHRGFIWFEVETIGRASHGSRYTEGIDANMRMGRFLGRLEKLGQNLLERTPHPLAGPPSLHAALIEGGSEISTYADRCVLRMERRIMPGETVEQTQAELQAIIDELSTEDETFVGSVKPYFHREPFAIAEDAPIVEVLGRVAQERLGKALPHIGATFWTDAAVFASAGMETVLFGPVGAGLHSAEEWVDLASMTDLANILTQTAIEYCG